MYPSLSVFCLLLRCKSGGGRKDETNGYFCKKYLTMGAQPSVLDTLFHLLFVARTLITAKLKVAT